MTTHTDNNKHNNNNNNNDNNGLTTLLHSTEINDTKYLGCSTQTLCHLTFNLVDCSLLQSAVDDKFYDGDG